MQLSFGRLKTFCRNKLFPLSPGNQLSTIGTRSLSFILPGDKLGFYIAYCTDIQHSKAHTMKTFVSKANKHMKQKQNK